ncbi:MAG TPA: hypothetical protein PK390_07535 [Fervidobacterium nodosum]|nr:hypothetical protein [Fervidobacterium nodosum]
MTVEDFKRKLVIFDDYYKQCDEHTKKKINRKAELYELLMNLSSSREELNQTLDRYMNTLIKFTTRR